MTNLQEIFLKVLVNNVNADTLAKYKEVAFDIATGNKDDLMSLIGTHVDIVVETYVRTTNTIKEFCNKHLIEDVNYDATYNNWLDGNKDKEGYFRTRIDATVYNINIYSTTPFTIRYKTRDGWQDCYYSSIEALSKDNMKKTINDIIYNDVTPAPATIEINDII